MPDAGCWMSVAGFQQSSVRGGKSSLPAGASAQQA
ncbi:hypothetical protein H650_16635 [Enterobacter sp. R4-368]|nr:hypothetical protein H650_16635 [Enterobacter sp. R4-368]